MGEARIASYNEAISALSAFDNAGDLKGAAYDSGKQYGMNVITPLLKGAIMYTELVSEAVPKLPSKYQSEVGGEDLDSEVLESEIRSLEASLHGIRWMYYAMVGDESTSTSTLSSLLNRMDSLTGQRNEKMDKLRKLNLFAGSSNEVFSAGEGSSLVDNLAQNLQTGLSQIQTEFSSFSGTFSSHSNDMEWAKNIEGEWDKKAKIDEDYQKVLEKIKDGKELNEDDVKKIDAYKKRYSNRELPEDLLKKIEDYKEKTTLTQEDKNNFLEKFQNYCEANDIDVANMTQETLKDFIQNMMEDAPDELARKAPEFYKFISKEVAKSGAKASLYGVLKTFSSTGNATTAGKVGNFIGNVFSKAKPFVQKTGKVFGGALTAFDFFDQLDSGENVVNAAAKTALHSYVSTAVTSTVTTSVAGGVGGTIGAFVGTLIPVPGVGTAIGYGLGLATGVAVSWAVNKIVDFAYDKTVGKAVNATLKAGGELVNNVSKGVKSVGKAIGDGVSGFFGGLGNAFGF